MDKYCHFKSFINTTQEYFRQPNAVTSTTLQRYLGVISATIDLSIFDPSSSTTTEFYTCLYNLMSNLNSKMTLMWNAIDVLQMACKNAAARQALIHTYRFVPILTKLLEECPSFEKKMRTLRIIEELTFGIRIGWQEAHLPSLISILTQCILESKEDEVIGLALGVLINICYKNLAVLYTLVNSVNIKLFTSKLLKLNAASEDTRIKSCKFLIILENMGKDISETMVLQFVTVTFNSIIPALKNRDSILLRHIIEFYANVKSNERSYQILLKYKSYAKNIEIILNTLEDVSDPECIGLMMEFFVFILKLKLKELTPMYPNIVKSAMKWVPVEQVSSRALALIKYILTSVGTSASTSNEVPDILDVIDISVLLLVSNVYGDMSDLWKKHSEEMITRFAELMQVLEELVKYKNIRIKILQSFSLKSMQAILQPLLSTKEQSFRGEENRNYLQAYSSSMFIHALSLISNLSTDNLNWSEFYTNLLRTKKVQMIIAHALFIGDELVKEKIFSLSETKPFWDHKSEVASAMKGLEPLLLIQSGINGVINVPQLSSFTHHYPEFVPSISSIQQDQLNVFIEKFENSFDSNNITNIPTSAVMELYEYKLAAMRNSEKAMQNSLEAADNYATNLQHRLVQISAASNRLHEMLFYTQQCLEGCQKEKKDLLARIEETEAESKKIHTQLLQQSEQKFQKEMALKEATIQKMTEENANLSRKLDTIQELLRSQ